MRATRCTRVSATCWLTLASTPQGRSTPRWSGPTWHIGELIDAHLAAETRSEAYGTDLLGHLSTQLAEEFGTGFDPTNLRNMQRFFQAFDIRDAARLECSEDRVPIDVSLSWTHYRRLTGVKNSAARRWYHNEAISSRWSTRELDRQITTSYYERGLTQQRNPSTALEPADGPDASQILKDPYVLDFLGVSDRSLDDESELEEALIEQLRSFLLELGRGFSFVGRQQRISIDGVHYRIDLVFYHYILKCFVLIELKTGKLDHRDIGQMDFYVRYWENETRRQPDHWPHPVCREERSDGQVHVAERPSNDLRRKVLAVPAIGRGTAGRARVPRTSDA